MFLQLFQSTRPRGARQSGSPTPASVRGSFNPRAHVGRDRVSRVTFSTVTEVSIHAPTWGATSPRCRRRCCRCVSIHAPTWGATSPATISDVLTEFQSTRPRGARHKSSIFLVHGFQFQSTRPRGARPWRLSSYPCSWRLFQSTRPRGARLSVSILLIRSSSFNPRAHVGRDKGQLYGINTLKVSIHAPTWGATLSAIGTPLTHRRFNPRAHVGRDLIDL